MQLAGSPGATGPPIIDELRRTEVNVANLGFCNNKITTSKYTMVSFVPRSLFEQFRRVANIYFLGISILMIIGTYAPSVFESPLLPFSTIGPLVLVLAITMAKEGVEDFKRHRSDREVNNRKVSVLQAGGPDLETTWLELRVGQVIRVHNKHEVCAATSTTHTRKWKNDKNARAFFLPSL
jgi:phospholipid-transporting ATPase